MKRYEYFCSGGITEDADGDYVLYTDHEAEVGRLKSSLLAIRNAYASAEYTHGGDLRGLDEEAIDTAFDSVADLMQTEVYDPQASRWECVNESFGAVVYDGLFENEARVIAAQHGLVARKQGT